MHPLFSPLRSSEHNCPLAGTVAMATWFFPRNLAALSSLNSSTLILEVEPTDKLKRKSHLNQTEGHSYTPGPAMTCSQVSSLEIQLPPPTLQIFTTPTSIASPRRPSLTTSSPRPQKKPIPFTFESSPSAPTHRNHLFPSLPCELLKGRNSVMFICFREGLGGIGSSYILLDDWEMKSGGVRRLEINFCND